MDYEAALRGALADEDALLLERFQDKSMESAISGSTVALCFVNLSTGDLIVGNLGDSRAVLADRDPKTNLSYSVVSPCFPLPVLFYFETKKKKKD